MTDNYVKGLSNLQHRGHQGKMRIRVECVISTDSWTYSLGIVKLITKRNRYLDLT